jgi:hypothetical protein
MAQSSSPVRLIASHRHGDPRGWLAETYNIDTFRDLGITCTFVQDNLSLSRAAFTLRGLHFQLPPYGQDKLVRCARGRVFDVVLDVRRGSPSWGQWVGTELSAENGRQLFVLMRPSMTGASAGMIQASAFSGPFPMIWRPSCRPRTRPSRCSPISTAPSHMTAGRWCLLPETHATPVDTVHLAITPMSSARRVDMLTLP